MNDQNAPAIATTMVDNLVVNGLAAWQDGIAALLDSLPETAISEVERWAREALGGTPVPLDPTTRSELARRRAILERLAAEAAARDGRPEELLALLLKAWREHRESPAPYVEYLVELGRNDEAAVMVRYLLGKEDCPDRSRIEAALETTGSPPEGWPEAVLAFAEAPSVEAWKQLMVFTPDDSYYHRTRNTLQMLIRLGVDGDVLFQCATLYGTNPTAIELVDRGLVQPTTVVERSRRGTAQSRGLWLALAARAAQARGDRFLTVRLLADAMACADPAFPPLLQVWTIREDADDELNAMLDKVGIPALPA